MAGVKTFKQWYSLKEATNTSTGPWSPTSSGSNTGSWHQSTHISNASSTQGQSPDDSSVDLGGPPGDGGPHYDLENLRPLQRIAAALQVIDPSINVAGEYQNTIRNPDGSVSHGYLGTPDYSAPEQARTAYTPARIQEKSNYERFLVDDIPRLFPELRQPAAQLRGMWQNFRNTLVDRLQNDPDNTNGISQNLAQLSSAHQHIASQTEDQLQSLLDQARNDPRSYQNSENHVQPIVYATALSALRNGTQSFQQALQLLQ